MEDFDKLAGTQGAALTEATKNVIYRGWNPKFKSDFVDEVSKETGIARAGTGKFGPDKKDGTKGAEILEAEPKYIERVLAGGFTKEQLQPIADRVAAATPFDPSASTRGGARVGKEYLDLADGVIAQGDEKVAQVIEKLKSLNPTFGDIENVEDEADPRNGKPSRESIGALIKANTVRKAQEDLV